MAFFHEMNLNDIDKDTKNKLLSSPNGGMEEEPALGHSKKKEAEHLRPASFSKVAKYYLATIV